MTGKKTRPTIGIIGFGKMTSALVARLIAAKTLAPKQLLVSQHKQERDRRLARQFGVRFAELQTVCETCDVLLLGVKPVQMAGVLHAIRPFLKNQPIWTIAAGLPTHFYEKTLGRKIALIRLMPNLPCQIGSGVITFFTTATVRPAQKKYCITTLAATGLVIELKREEQMHTSVALAGSGPAFFYEFVANLEQAAIRLGLPAGLAQTLARQTFLGAALLLQNSTQSPQELIAQIASTKGTTEAGLESLRQNQFAATITRCLQATAKRSKSLAKLK